MTMVQYLVDLLSSLASCFSCFPGSPQLKIGGKSFKILRLLGEGGFSYVYLVQEHSTGHLYALKKIRCPFGQESVSLALKEVEAYKLFSPHPNIINSIGHHVTSANDRTDPGSKTVYILLPYYRRGNLQDAINANLINHTTFPQRHLMILFLGVARALKVMHQYKVKGETSSLQGLRQAREVRQEGWDEDEDARRMVKGLRGRDKQDEEDIENQPLIEDEVVRSQEGAQEGVLRAYAHRDIKPGNIMIDDDGKTPILMDLGSIAPSPTAITSRSLALAIQDTAAEHSTMSYRAPELFDVKTGSVIDAKVDIWSLGCTMYACLVGKSPFEARSEETGGSLSMCVLGGDWRFPRERQTDMKSKSKLQPAEDEINESIKELIRKCLRVEPAERPDIDELINTISKIIADLPEEGSDG